MGAPASRLRDGRRRFAVQADCVAKIDNLLNVERYARRWPRIPRHELWASSVPHPALPGARWLLHTRRMPSMEPQPSGKPPPVQACYDCARSLCKDFPKAVQMPKYALANDNWIGRLPFAFMPGGQPLHDMELKSLVRG